MLLEFIDPVTFQLLSNLKVLTTTILARVWLKKQFKKTQWLAIFLLLIGSMMTTRPDEQKITLKLGSTITGLIGMIFYCTLSAVAGIATEYIMKLNSSSSIHFQNMQLYLYGIIFNGIGLYLESNRYKTSIWNGLNSNIWVIVAILNQSLTGLLISGIIKYADNIIKLFIIAGATIVSYIFSYLLFGVMIDLHWLYSAFIILSSIYLYNMSLIHTEY